MENRILRLSDAGFVVRQCAVDEIIPLRHRILRSGLPIEEAHFEGDLQPDTAHVAAFLESNNSAMCCATMVNECYENKPAWKLRGMATDAAWQSRGLGNAVLQYLIDLVKSQSDIRLFWCNARIGALEFYKRQGWTIESEIFDIPTAGLHYRMKLDLQ